MMASAIKSELFATIEHQKEKIKNYEAKLSDLVKAYKGLAKEKDALHASLIALSENKSESDKNKSEASAETESKNQDDDSENSALKKQIATLTSTVKTLSDEKSKLEISTKNERKRILDEKKGLELMLKNETEEWNKSRTEYETKIQDLKSKIIVFQHEREKEATNGIIMLREVENRLSKERSEKEKMEKLLDEMQEQNRQFALALGTRSQEKQQHRQIIELQNELEQVRCRLKKAEKQCEKPPLLTILQDQMNQMKLQYMDAISKEQSRAESAEESVRKMSQTHEQRVAALESRLAELSLTAASCDRSKQTYLETIHSLKDKLAELAEENKSLQYRVNDAPPSPKEVDGDTLVKKVISLWTQLNHMDENKTPNLSRLEELLQNNESIHRKCVRRYKSLEQECEDLNKKLTQLDEGSGCRCGLKEQTESLRERIRSLNAATQTTQAMHERQVSSLREEIKSLRSEHQQHLKLLDHDHKTSLANLEQQLTEHRHRSLVTLRDRDEEIHRLSKEIYDLNREAQTQPSTVAAALLSQVNVGESDGPLLHHLEDLARKELEVGKLRKEKIQLERSMREIHMAMIEKQQTMQDTIDDLREELEKTKRNISREGENYEYLKNVVLQYMTSTDVESRQVILNAIAAVLKFTPRETEAVRKSLAMWWWQAPSKSKAPHHILRRSSVTGGPSYPNGRTRSVEWVGQEEDRYPPGKG